MDFDGCLLLSCLPTEFIIKTITKIKMTLVNMLIDNIEKTKTSAINFFCLIWYMNEYIFDVIV